MMTEDRLEEVYNGMSEEQKEALHYMVGLALVHQQEKIRSAIRRILVANA